MNLRLEKDRFKLDMKTGNESITCSSVIISMENNGSLNQFIAVSVKTERMHLRNVLIILATLEYV